MVKVWVFKVEICQFIGKNSFSKFKMVKSSQKFGYKVKIV